MADILDRNVIILDSPTIYDFKYLRRISRWSYDLRPSQLLTDRAPQSSRSRMLWYECGQLVDSPRFRR